MCYFLFTLQVTEIGHTFSSNILIIFLRFRSASGPEVFLKISRIVSRADVTNSKTNEHKITMVSQILHSKIVMKIIKGFPDINHI